jgi:hypothetical protein
MNDMMRNGNITISRPRGGGCEHVEIRIEDDTSGCRAIEVEVPIKDFAEALLGQGFIACRFTLNTSGVIGKQRELRNILIKRPPLFSKKQAREDGLKWIKKQASDELVDGWEPHHPQDVFNAHRWEKPDQVRVSLIRFVESATSKEGE